MINIREDNYEEACSCCDGITIIVAEVESIYSEIDFCQKCWDEFVEKMKKYTNKKIHKHKE